MEYEELASNLLSGKGFILEDGMAFRNMGGRNVDRPTGLPTAFRTPGFPFILAGIHRVAGHDHALARRALTVASSLTAPVLFGLCLILFGRTHVALLAGLAWALLPTSRMLAGALLGEASAALLLTGAMAIAVFSERRQSVLAAGSAGLILGSAVLTRGFLLPVILAVPAWFVSRRSARLAVIALAAAVAPLGAWVARNAIVLGMPVLSTQTQEVIWQGNNAWARGSWPGDASPQRAYLLWKYPDLDRLDEVGYSRMLGREAFREFIGHPRRIAWLVPRKLLIFFTPISYLGIDWMYLFLLPFAAFGGRYLWTRPELRSTLLFLCLPIVGVLAICVFTFSDVRFSAPSGSPYHHNGVRRTHSSRRIDMLAGVGRPSVGPRAASGDLRPIVQNSTRQ